MAPGDKRDDKDLIPLTRWRAALARARHGRRAAALLAEPDAHRIVPALPVQELYYLVEEVGLADAHELLALATPEQVRGFLDFDVWNGDTLAGDKVARWLDTLADLGPARLASLVGGLDKELPALFIARTARVYDLSLEAPPEEPEGRFYPTPDTFFLLDITATGEEGARVERLLDWLYRADLARAREILMAARWELPSDLEEWAYRWRGGRMADLGFPDYYEALEVYRWLDPASVRVGENSVEPAPEGGATLPALVAESVGERGFFARALATVDDAADLERIEAALVVLANRVMTADKIAPGDLAAVPAALARVAATLSLGLEFLGRGDATRAGEALRTVALVRIFRVGFSLTLKLKRAADTLAQRGWVTLVPGATSLLDGDDAAIVAALRAPRPLFPLVLDEPNRGGDGASDKPPPRAPTRTFATLADVGHAAAAIERIARLATTVQGGLGVEPRLLDPEAMANVHPRRELVTFTTLAATLAANVVLDRPPSLVPLTVADLREARARAVEDGRLRPTARLAVRRAFDARLAERGAEAPPEWDALVDKWLAALESTLAPSAIASPAMLPDLVTGLLVRG